MNENEIIQIQQLSRTYILGKIRVEALKSIDFNIKRNEYVAIMGPSGSGKTTLMNIIGCLDTPTSGNYFLNNIDVSNMQDQALAQVRNKEIGFVFQTFNLLSRSNCYANVELPLIYAGLSNHKRRELVLRTLERVGLADRMTHKPNELSGGQRQRVAIARALVNEPSILLADEPTGNLDSKTGEEIMMLFEELYRTGNTIILVTHEPDIAKYARRIIYLKDGMIESDKNVSSVKLENNSIFNLNQNHPS